VRVALIGGGSWGTALAGHLGRRGLDVRLWVREPEIVESIERTRKNAWYLADVELPSSVRATVTETGPAALSSLTVRAQYS